jgi:F420-dependent oxidoreductase-like protein
MDLRIFTEPQQGATYLDQLTLARRAEDAGFGAFFRSDHYLAMGVDGHPGPTDSWVTLAGLARETSRIRLGTLVSSATFRHPGPLAVSVAEVDQMSGGRVELGLGTGWYEAEHSAFGLPFGTVGERFDRFEEQLRVLQGLWTSPGPFDFAGKHYQLSGNPALTRPVQDPLPIIIGGGGAKRTPRLAATYAHEFNIGFRSHQDSAAAFERVREACRTTGRELTLSVAQTVAVGRDDAEVDRRIAATGNDPDELRANALVGTVSEVVDRIGRFAEAGATRFYLQLMDMHDLEHVDLIASEVAPQL